VTSHERRNRDFWDDDADAYQAVHAPDLDRAPRAWGVWRIPEADLGALGDVVGRDVLEFGCGAAQWSVALARAGARPVGLDQSRAQLGHARRLQQEHGVEFPLVCASGEAVPLGAGSFDVVFCDHGAVSFCDPDRSVPEVARLLRPGGRFVFSHASPLLYMTWDREAARQTRHLHEPYFGMRELDYGDGTVDFQMPYGEWIRLFRRNGFVVDDLIELRPPKGAKTTYTEMVPRGWARKWPAEQIWKLHKEA
jgi:SAM-dependent methyltransferase